MNQLQKELQEWGERVCVECRELIERGKTDKDFYVFQTAIPVKSPELLLVGINPGGGKTYEEQVSKCRKGQHRETIEDLAQGYNIYKDVENNAFQSRALSRIASLSHLIESDNVTGINVCYFNTNNVADLNSDVLAFCAKQTKELIEILQPKRIIFLTSTESSLKLVGVEKIKGVKSARILYIYPSTTSRELISRIIASPIFHNYFDMPIQHISENMLKIMKRGSGAKKIKELLNLMRNAKNSFLRTGVIVGHPGESEEDFNELCEFLEEFKFDRISAFAYSKEEDTASFEMEQIPAKIISKRLSKIEKITKKAINESLQKELGKQIYASLEGISSEGEMFYAAKKDIWDKDIDGEILINESDVKELEIGSLYLCEVSDVVDQKLVATIIKKVK